ncbi:two-component sensor histidine kinase [Paenibacillus sp. FSL H7-0326]|uniref:ATP-binding protein n=1 Tax=Paenibacillus sp. FSL H7-0326 TaxID=1921144 RepID=UPI00096D0BE1|nr:ATP-binding protein [Paenibacillus sp. FSL H7-0326]OMC66163.1 two-component sensor histidine kinase [Paenibacillus sp. FSL H7-0326]
MLETLLLNFLILLFPVVIFLIFFENRPVSYNKKILIILSTVAMCLCMLMPFQLEYGYTFDLRYIPFLLVALFGGYRCSFPLFVALIVCRLYVGGEGVLPAVLFAISIFIAAPLYSKRFLGLAPKRRIVAAAATAFLTMLWYLITLIIVIKQVDATFWNLAGHALTTYTVFMMIAMMLIEKIIANAHYRDRVLQSERLNVVSELAASVSHEIRNPLTVTSGFLQLLSKSETMTEKERGYIKLSLEELKRAEKIVSDYLSFAKPQSQNMVYADLSEDLEYTTNIILPYAMIYDVEVETHYDNSLSTNYDQHQIQQCLINLYKNAIESMKEKGGGKLIIHISEHKGSIVIRIEDTGVGMDKEELSRLGKPYYSTKQEGTGLGMLMVYSTINKLKGRIEVDSKKGQGTVFRLIIPAAPPDEERA